MIENLILACPFTKDVWKEVESMLGIINVWEGGDIEKVFISWYSKTLNERRGNEQGYFWT